MDLDFLWLVMTEITLMGMDAVKIVKFKLDLHVTEDHQTAKILAVLLNQLQFQLHQKVNPNYSDQ